MKQVAQLIQDDQRKVVVLSAMSGMTNTLTEIVNALYKGEKDAVYSIVDDLEKTYAGHVETPTTENETKDKVLEMLEGHWSHILSFTLDMFTPFEERTLLAQGELISTQMMQFYLEEKGVRSALLPALDFMRFDQQGEPDMWYVKSNLERMIKEHADVDLFITQGYICRNHFGDLE